MPDRERCKSCDHPIYDPEDADYQIDCCNGVRTWGPDPFREEILGDDTPYLQCDGQRWQSAQAI